MRCPNTGIGTREEWQVARDELAKLEAAQAKRNEEITSTRRDLPWVRVEKDYEIRHRGRQEDPGRAVRRALAAARLQQLAVARRQR